jgi:hypothetical protein
MASVTTGPAHEVSPTLEALYDEFDGSGSDYDVFDKVVTYIRQSKIAEPFLSQEIEKVKTAMMGHLPPSDVERRIRSGRVGKRQSGDIEATVLYNAASSKLDLYQDTTNVYARFEADDGHYELHPLASTPVRDYLRKLAQIELEKVVRRDIINSVIDQLHANEAKPAHLSHRIAQHNGSFYYDMADPEWTAIEIAPEAWQPCYDPPPVFITNSLQAEQAEPDQSATIPDISKFVALLAIPDPDQALLTVVWLISTFIPTIKIPILYIYGEKGSGKTFLEKALLQIADPTVSDPITQDVNVLGQPPNREAAITQMSHRHVVAYDNLYSIPPWFANLLSTRTTGSSEEKKKLYTDSEPYLMRLNGPIIINGIHRRGLKYTDLQDRIIAIKLDRRNDNASEAQYWKEFTKMRSTVLGAILGIISEAMRIEPALNVKPVSRFVDFERWGCAIAQAMNGVGYSKEAFIKAYNANIKNVRYSVLEGHPIAQCLIHLRDTAIDKEWAGTPDKLLLTLNTVAAKLGVDTTQKTWPRNAVWLTRRLDEIRSNLMEIGISYSERPERTAKGTRRIIRLAFPFMIAQGRGGSE